MPSELMGLHRRQRNPQSFGNQTGTNTIVLVSTGDVPQTVALTAMTMDIKEAATSLKPVQQTLAQQGFEGRLDVLFSLDPLGSISEYARFRTPANSAGVFAHPQSKAAGSGLVTMPAQDAGYWDLSFSPLTNSANPSTDLTLINAGSQPFSTRIDAFDPQGSTVNTETLTVGSNAGWSNILSNVLATTENQVGRRVQITASSLILAAQVSGSISTSTLTAVPSEGSVLAPQTIGQLVLFGAGETVTSADSLVSLAVPLAALSRDTALCIAPLNVASLPHSSRNEQLVGVVEGTHRAHFKIPLRLRFSLTETIHPGSTINLLILNPGAHRCDLNKLIAKVDPAGRTASDGATHFTQVCYVKVGRIKSTEGL